MHILLILISVLTVWLKKDYLDWKKYYPTMQYIALGNLTYHFLCNNYLLWQMTSDLEWIPISLLEMSYTYITFPLTVLMFLARYPEEQSKAKILGHYLLWVGIYIGVEFILMLQGNIVYNNGWGIGWSAIFVCVMFPFLRLHYKRPLLTMVLSVPVTLFWIWLFEVPVPMSLSEMMLNKP